MAPGSPERPAPPQDTRGTPKGAQRRPHGRTGATGRHRTTQEDTITADTALLAADTTARITATTTDLEWVARSWPDLHQLRLPGNRRPARRTLTRAARAVMDTLVRTERAERRPGERILGASPAPVAVGILDDLAQLLADAVETADRISWNAGAADVEPPSSGYDFDAIGRHLAHIGAHLAAATATDPDALDIAQRFAARARRTLERALEDAVDGQVLTTLCAWCHGATTETPAGGQTTLTIRVIAGQPLVVCESDLCEPPSEECGTWLRGRPAWPWAEWDWLARRLGGGAVARTRTGTTPEEAVRKLLKALRERPEDTPASLAGLLDDGREG